jgi:hypothetical protein
MYTVRDLPEEYNPQSTRSNYAVIYRMSMHRSEHFSVPEPISNFEDHYNFLPSYTSILLLLPFSKRVECNMDNEMETRKLQQNESLYRKLYSAILTKHKGVLQQRHQHYASIDDGCDVFAEEQNMLNRIFQTEVQNLALGVGATAVCFALLGFAKTSGLSTIFGISKARAFLQAKEQAKKIGTEGTQNRIGTKRNLDCVNVMISR